MSHERVMKLLHIDSSVLGPNSVSRQVSKAVVEQLRVAHPSLEVTYRDLVAQPLPHMTMGHLLADHPMAMNFGPKGDDALAFAADRVISQEILDEFVAAEIVVLGAAMYNFTIPSQLK